MRNQRNLVTGGAGFIGSHLCDALLARGEEVLCLDNYYTGDRHNLKAALGHPRFTLLEQDVCGAFHTEVDQIYNLACPASPRHYQNDPIQTTKTNVLGAINLLDLASRLGIRILQASTSEVYGDPEVHPQPESYWGRVNPVGPRSCYDEGKRCAETLFFDYRRQYGLSIKVLRIFNTYGPRMAVGDGRVVSNFIVQALRGEAITLYGDGLQSRSFCFVNDMVAALLAFMETPDACCGPLNAGNPCEITMFELAELILRLTGSRSRIEFHPLPEDDPRQRQPDISLARELMDWHPQVPLEEGLEETIAYFRGMLS